MGLWPWGERKYSSTWPVPLGVGPCMPFTSSLQGVGGGGVGPSAGGPFGVGAVQYCWQGAQGVSVRLSGSLLGDSEVLAYSLGVAGEARCAVSSLCDAFPRSFNGH